MTNHPFLDKSFFVRWSELTSEHIKPDIDKALLDAQENLEAICGISLEEVSYENVLIGLEKATEALDEAWGKVSHLTSVCDSEALRAVYNELLPKVSEFYARIPLNDKLWAAFPNCCDAHDVAQDCHDPCPVNSRSWDIPPTWFRSE